MSHERLLAARRHIDERRFREAIVELHVVLENETKPSRPTKPSNCWPWPTSRPPT